MANNIDFLVYRLPKEIEMAIYEGEYSVAKKLIEKYLANHINAEMSARLNYELERLARIKKDYPFTREKALIILHDKLENFKSEEFQKWFNNGYIDHIQYNGKYLYFSRFFENLLFLNDKLTYRKKIVDKKAENSKKLLRDRIDKIKKGERLKYRVTAGIKIDLKKYKKYRVWLPIPVENEQIDNIKIIKTVPEYTEISKKSPQKTIYFESKEKTYYVEFQYDIKERSINAKEDYPNVKQDAKISENLKEKYPHVMFSPYLKKLTESVVNNEKDQYVKAKKIYDWITENIRYTYVPNYSLFDNISEYVATSLRGDCGMQALLFITMSRIAKIPAKWQSGWYINPYYASPHDWAQIYIDPYGWIPADPSFGNVEKNKNIYQRDFYFGNLDGFRMIANEDFQVDFDPSKKYFRSDPIDNQCGEVETDQENIYSDKFKYKIFIKKFEKVH